MTSREKLIRILEIINECSDVTYFHLDDFHEISSEWSTEECDKVVDKITQCINGESSVTFDPWCVKLECSEDSEPTCVWKKCSFGERNGYCHHWDSWWEKVHHLVNYKKAAERIKEEIFCE